jgi:hypothetical protein
MAAVRVLSGVEIRAAPSFTCSKVIDRIISSWLENKLSCLERVVASRLQRLKIPNSCLAGRAKLARRKRQKSRPYPKAARAFLRAVDDDGGSLVFTSVFVCHHAVLLPALPPIQCGEVRGSFVDMRADLVK